LSRSGDAFSQTPRPSFIVKPANLLFISKLADAKSEHRRVLRYNQVTKLRANDLRKRKSSCALCFFYNKRGRRFSVNKKIKSVHITNYYHKNSGGISNSYNRLLEAAARHSRHVRLIVPGERDETEIVNEYAKIYYVEAPQSPVFDKRYRILLPWKTYLKNHMPIRRILLDEMPDMIEIAEKYSLSLLAGIIRMGHFKKLGRPMLVHFSCERMDDNVRSFLSASKPAMWFARRVMGNYNFPMFDFHIGNSPYTAQELLDAVLPEKNPGRSKAFFNFCWRYFRAARTPIQERVFSNPRGVDNKLYNVKRQTPENRRLLIEESGFPATATVLLYAGRISPEKNVTMLPQLLEILARDKRRDYRLLLAGDGPQAQELKKEFELRAPGKAKFLGHLTDKEKLAALYANADVFVHPNPHEPFGIAPLEAMASGVPVVAPNSGGLLSYASNENAWLVAPVAKEFAAAVQSVFADDVRRRQKIENALATAQRHTWEASTNRLFALYDEMHEDFRRRRELYVYENIEPKEINFVRELLTEAR
jgi:glycosyltransferase involved in cell wall biosynthesis